jgi:hypothetical protein
MIEPHDNAYWGAGNECGVASVDVDALVNIGWREWVGLPDLSIRSIKAKIDTGARSSCLHAFDIEPFVRDGQQWVRFDVHPIQRNDRLVKRCEAVVFDRRHVRSSNGLTSERFVIQTTLMVVGQPVPIELTLANRDAMGFRMLIGREAMRGRFLVDSGRSYFGGRPVRKAKRKP